RRSQDSQAQRSQASCQDDSRGRRTCGRRLDKPRARIVRRPSRAGARSRQPSRRRPLEQGRASRLGEFVPYRSFGRRFARRPRQARRRRGRQARARPENRRGEKEQALTTERPVFQDQICARMKPAPTPGKSLRNEATPRADVLFVHIQKTGGMSLYNSMVPWFGGAHSLRYKRSTEEFREAFLRLADEQIAGYRLLAGH